MLILLTLTLKTLSDHKNKLLGNISHPQGVISHSVTAGPACGLFSGDVLKGQAVIHRSLRMYSFRRITTCHLRVGGQFASAGLQSRDLQPENLAALSANCSWVAFKFIDSLGDIVFLLCP